MFLNSLIFVRDFYHDSETGSFILFFNLWIFLYGNKKFEEFSEYYVFEWFNFYENNVMKKWRNRKKLFGLVRLISFY